MRGYPLGDRRLLAVAGLVSPGGVVADIGADHGHLICHLVSSGKAACGYACDISPQPLAKAQALIRRLGLEEKIEARLTDGLAGLPLERLTDVVMAGMGGELIASLLQASPAAQTPPLNFVLQPMTKGERLRAALGELGFALAEEHGVQSQGRLYTVMRVNYTGERRAPDPLFCWTGRLPDSPLPASAALLEQTARRLHRAAGGMSRADPEQARRLEGVAGEIDRLLQAPGRG